MEIMVEDATGDQDRTEETDEGAPIRIEEDDLAPRTDSLLTNIKKRLGALKFDSDGKVSEETPVEDEVAKRDEEEVAEDPKKKVEEEGHVEEEKGRKVKRKIKKKVKKTRKKVVKKKKRKEKKT